MPIISKIEAKTAKGRFLYAVIITALTIGGATMLYPFVLMVSGSIRSELDETDLDLVPRFLFDDGILYRKFLETKYNQEIQTRNQAHLRQDFTFRNATIPSEVNQRRVSDYEAFLAQKGLRPHWQTLGSIHGIRTVPENLRELRNRLSDRFDNDLAAFNRAVGTALPSWQSIVIAPPRWVTQRYDYPDNVLFEVYFQIQQEAHPAEQFPVSLSGYFLDSMIFPVYGQLNTDAYNEAHRNRPLADYQAFALPPTVPGEDQPTLRAEWIEFVREELNPSFVLLEEVSDESFRAYLKEVHGTVENLNRTWGTDLEAFDELVLPSGEWLRGAPRMDYLDFLQQLPPEHYRLIGPEFAWRDWLRSTYGNIAALNAAHGTEHTAFEQAHLPLEEHEKAYVLAHGASLRWRFVARNYINVIDELFLRGRAFLNTVIFCTLSVLLALLVNPLTAYALSRFQLPGSYKMLLLLMATMAFPPMVTLIPTFIILQQLNLMNTFAALVLPTVANGYLIFLLKGFFDSLPRELYQAAMIDGASEVRIFFQITMALSKPILAVVALMAFNSSYTMFLYPLLVAPRQDMWLLSVWLYQYQLTASMAGVFASVLIASVPTLLVFIFAQNIIMRGIVVPTEK